MMQRLEALESKKSQVTVEKQAMCEEIDGADEISEVNPIHEDLVEQNTPPLNPIAKQVQFPSPELKMSFSVVKCSEAKITQYPKH